MTEVVSRSTSRERFNMLLMTVFGGSALLLAAIGIYGLMAYSVQQRTQEIGIRMALGALAGDVRNMVVFQGMRLALVGVVVGIAAALALCACHRQFSVRRAGARPRRLRRHTRAFESRGAARGVAACPPRQSRRSRHCPEVSVMIHTSRISKNP